MAAWEAIALMITRRRRYDCNFHGSNDTQVDKIDSDLKHALSQYEESRARSQKVYVVVSIRRLKRVLDTEMAASSLKPSHLTA